MSELQNDRKEDVVNTDRDRVAFQVLTGCLVGDGGPGLGDPCLLEGPSPSFLPERKLLSPVPGQGVPGLQVSSGVNWPCPRERGTVQGLCWPEDPEPRCHRRGIPPLLPSFSRCLSF